MAAAETRVSSVTHMPIATGFGIQRALLRHCISLVKLS